MKKQKDANWRLLERIAYEYVRKLHADSVILNEEWTTSSHDSGYDGIWLLLPKDETILQKILMEAKFRKSQTSLPLNDCAKSIIIAFNLSADQLFIVTNIAFSSQVMENVERFKHRSDLGIICISGTELKTFIQDNREYLIENCDIPEGFLNDIIEQKITLSKIKTRAVSDNTIHKDILFLDKARKYQIRDIVNGFIFHSSFFLLTGNEGIGKSYIGKSVKEELQKKNFEVCNIDLNLCTSSRVLYLKILESIWGVSLISILEDKKLLSYIDQLITVYGGIKDSNIADAIKYILLSEIHDYEGHKDIYLHLLLQYIDLIINTKKDKIHLAIFFENLNAASEDIVAFLTQIVTTLRKNNIRVLLEIRTPFLIQGYSDFELSQLYFRQFQQLSDREFAVQVFARNTSIALIKNSFSIDDRICDHLAYILGDSPLEIQSALEIIKNNDAFLPKELVEMSDSDLEDFWDTWGISTNSVVLSLIYQLSTLENFPALFELSSLLNGEVPFEIIEKIFKTDSSNLIKDAINSTVFEEYGECLKCKHLRFLASMKKLSMPGIRLKVAESLLPIIQNYKEVKPEYLCIELNLLFILNRISSIPPKTLEVANMFIRTQQYKEALQTLILCINTLKEVLSKDLGLIKQMIKVILLALTCIQELHEDNNESYNFIYELAKEYIYLENLDLDSNKAWYKYCLFIWHQKFVAGEFEECLNISQRLYDKLHISEILFEESEDYPGQVFNAYGLSSKMLFGGQLTEQIFEEGIKKYPYSFYAKAALLSQQGNSLLKTEPILAAKKYRELLEIVKGKNYSYQEVLHTRIDIAMSYFLAEEYDMGKVWAENGAKTAASIGILSQKGRALNILGCCYAAEKKYDSSMKFFLESISLLNTSKAIIYLWRVQLNLASILLINNENGNDDKASKLIDQVLESLKNNFKTKIENDSQSVPYQGLLLITMYLDMIKKDKSLKKVFKDFEDSKIEKDFSCLSIKKNWKNLFRNKVKFCNGIVLVTG